MAKQNEETKQPETVTGGVATSIKESPAYGGKDKSYKIETLSVLTKTNKGILAGATDRYKWTKDMLMTVSEFQAKINEFGSTSISG